MSLDVESLRRYYASLNPEALAQIDLDDLTPEARAIVASQLGRHAESPSPSDSPDLRDFFLSDAPPPWFETAAYACSFANRPGAADSPEALEAIKYLSAAGIPTYLSLNPAPSDGDAKNVLQDFVVYVPGYLAVKASAVLDVKMFNPRADETWRTHLASISDDELSQITPEVVCAGMKDLIERYTRSYNEELSRRGEAANPNTSR
jgi:hypothetical protein